MSEKVILSESGLRQLQLNELEMLVEVDRICRKYQIQYSLDGGTLLGAVRHQGFIPWDDDADVIFTRHEYARFFRACARELDTSRFFLQEYRTDPGYRWGYAKMRRKGTEYVRINQENLAQRTGVCIDIFVVDNVPDLPILRRLYYAMNFCIRKVLYSELGKTAEQHCWMRKWYQLLNRIPKTIPFRVRNVLAFRCNQRPTKLVSHLLYPYPRKNCKYGMPSECFQTYMDMDFEGMQFLVMQEYDCYLSILYGDYMTLPPVERRVGCADACKIITIPVTLEEIQMRYKQENK